jgi:hypothetical protein
VNGSGEVILDDLSTMKEEPVTEPVPDASREELEKEIEEMKIKIARLFEKENELEEMAMNDPADAEEYEGKARTAREMRSSLEVQLKELEKRLQER